MTWERSTSKPRSASSDATTAAASSAPISQLAPQRVAVQVAVHGAGQDVVLLATVGPVAVADDPELLEDVEGPVDRRGDGRRIALPAPLDELGAGDVALGLGQHRDERAPLGRPAEPAVVQALAHGSPTRADRRGAGRGGQSGSAHRNGV